MIYCVDTETSGLNPFLGDYAFLIQWCDEHGKTGYCRVGEDPLDEIRAIMQDPGNQLVGHNIGFDLAFLAQLGMHPAGQIHDVLIMAHLRNPLEPSKALKALAAKYLGRENVEEARLEEWFVSHGMRAREGRRYVEVPEEIIVPYGLADVMMTMDLFKLFGTPEMLADPVYQLEIDLLPLCWDISRDGMRVDKTFAREAAERTARRAVELIAEGKARFEVDDIGKDAQVASALFDRAGLAVLSTTKTGRPCLDDDALSLYDHPLVALVREYRKVSRLNSTFLQPMLTKTDAHDVLHAKLNQTGARTGRMSSSDPNLENLPRNNNVVSIRKGFIPRSADHLLLLIDLSQIELRMLTHYTKDPVMTRTLCDRAGDLHAATAIALFEDAADKYRTIAKTMNFATIYGAGAAKLRAQINENLTDTQFTLGQVKEFRAKYFRQFPAIRDFQWYVEGLIRERSQRHPEGIGTVKGVSGRVYHCPADKAYRVLNYICQGESAMFFKKKMLDVQRVLRGTQTMLINVVHDEMIFDMHKSEQHLIPVLLDTIEDMGMFRVPIFAQCAASDVSWADKKKLLREYQRTATV